MKTLHLSIVVIFCISLPFASSEETKRVYEFRGDRFTVILDLSDFAQVGIALDKLPRSPDDVLEHMAEKIDSMSEDTREEVRKRIKELAAEKEETRLAATEWLMEHNKRSVPVLLTMCAESRTTRRLRHAILSLFLKEEFSLRQYALEIAAYLPACIDSDIDTDRLAIKILKTVARSSRASSPAPGAYASVILDRLVRCKLSPPRYTFQQAAIVLYGYTVAPSPPPSAETALQWPKAARRSRAQIVREHIDVKRLNEGRADVVTRMSELELFKILPNKFVQQARARLLQLSDADTRNEAIDWLEAADEQVIPVLITEYQHHKAETRVDIVHLLGYREITSGDVAADILRFIMGEVADDDVAIQMAALRGMAEMMAPYFGRKHRSDSRYEERALTGKEREALSPVLDEARRLLLRVATRKPERPLPVQQEIAYHKAYWLGMEDEMSKKLKKKRAEQMMRY